MTELARAALMAAAGGGLAGIWLAGLWLDVRGLARERRPYGRLAAGALARLTLVAAGFYLVIAVGGHWSDPLAALAGFLVVRQLVLAAVRRRGEASAPRGTV